MKFCKNAVKTTLIKKEPFEYKERKQDYWESPARSEQRQIEL